MILRYCTGRLEGYCWVIKKGSDPIHRNFVGAKHSDDNIRNLTKISLSECFALAVLLRCGRAKHLRTKTQYSLKSYRRKCFAPTELTYEGYHPRAIRQQYRILGEADLI